MRLLLVGNPASRRGRGLALTRLAERLLRETGAAVETVLTERPGHARELLSRPPGDVDRVVTCGGDGLVSEAAAALAGGDLPLAVLPGGRGNDLVRELDIPLDFAAAARLAASGRVGRIDLGEAGGRTFNTVAACGLDALVSRRARRSRLPLPGPAVYVVELLAALATFRGARVVVEHEGGRLEEEALLVAVANGPSYGGGIRIAPRASLQDGLLDVCLVRRIPAWRAAALFPTVQLGRHERRPEVVTLRARELRLSADPPLDIEADGEPLARTPATYRCLPAALPIVLPG